MGLFRSLGLCDSIVSKGRLGLFRSLGVWVRFAGQLMWSVESANEMQRLRFLPEFLDLDKDEIEE